VSDLCVAGPWAAVRAQTTLFDKDGVMMAILFNCSEPQPFGKRVIGFASAASPDYTLLILYFLNFIFDKI